MNEITNTIQTKLDVEIQWLGDFLDESRTIFRQEMACLNLQFDLLKQDWKEINRLKYRLKKLLKQGSRTTPNIQAKIIVKRKHYWRKMRKLKHQQTTCESDYQSHTKNKLQRLRTLEDAKKRLLEMANPVLVTLTYEDAPSGNDTAVHFVTQTFSRFINRLSKPIYKTAYKRFSKKVGYLAAYEVDNNKRLHIHAILNRPDHFAEKTFRKLVKKYWYPNGLMMLRNVADYFTEQPFDYASYTYKEKTKDLSTKKFSEFLIP